MRRPGGPIGFVALVLGLWLGVRSGFVLWTGDAEAVSSTPASVATRPSRASAGKLAGSSLFQTPFPVAAASPPEPSLPDSVRAACLDCARHEQFEASPAVVIAVRERALSASPAPAGTAAPKKPLSHSTPPAFAPGARGFSGSAWVFARSGSGSSLAGVGQLGGSQAGLRLVYALGRDPSAGLALFGRLSAPIEERRGKEAAFGIEWRPDAQLPVRIVAERRVGLDSGGRDAFALGLVGGVDQVPLPLKFRLDAYAQAGFVGVHARDPYVDGSVRVERRLARLGPIDVAAGGGLWGGAQPGAARLDAGPQLVMRIPAGDRTLRFGIDWRMRVAGDARPGSGVAATLATDF